MCDGNSAGATRCFLATVIEIAHYASRGAVRSQIRPSKSILSLLESSSCGLRALLMELEPFAVLQLRHCSTSYSVHARTVMPVTSRGVNCRFSRP